MPSSATGHKKNRSRSRRQGRAPPTPGGRCGAGPPDAPEGGLVDPRAAPVPATGSAISSAASSRRSSGWPAAHGPRETTRPRRGSSTAQGDRRRSTATGPRTAQEPRANATGRRRSDEGRTGCLHRESVRASAIARGNAMAASIELHTVFSAKGSGAIGSGPARTAGLIRPLRMRGGAVPAAGAPRRPRLQFGLDGGVVGTSTTVPMP